MNTKTYRRPATVATLTLLGGIAASLSGNLQAINLGNHQPGIGAYVSAIVWPLTLFAVVEVLLHTPWLNNWRDGLTKAVAVGFVGLMAAYISYFHLAHTLSAYGYDVVSRYAGPLAIDAAMVMATLALNRVGHARRGQVAKDGPVALNVDTTDHVLSSVQDLTEGWRLANPSLVPVTQEGLDDRMGEDIWTRLTDEMDNSVAPVSAVPVSPAPRSNEVKPESVPADAADLITTWMYVDPAIRPSAGDVDILLASEFGRQPRTIRRWRDALKG
jgi:hypothetical protein